VWRAPSVTLFPYTTLFRSGAAGGGGDHRAAGGPGGTALLPADRQVGAHRRGQPDRRAAQGHRQLPPGRGTLPAAGRRAAGAGRATRGGGALAGAVPAAWGADGSVGESLRLPRARRIRGLRGAFAWPRWQAGRG